jgi:hypothetical protein
MVGYDVRLQEDIEEFNQLVSVRDDEHIIPWIGARDGVWVHADDNARTEHRKQLVTENIRTIWLFRPKDGMSAKEELRQLSYCLPEILDDFASNDPQFRHYEIRGSGRVYPRPKSHGFVL